MFIETMERVGHAFMAVYAAVLGGILLYGLESGLIKAHQDIAAGFAGTAAIIFLMEVGIILGRPKLAAAFRILFMISAAFTIWTFIATCLQFLH